MFITFLIFNSYENTQHNTTQHNTTQHNKIKLIFFPFLLLLLLFTTNCNNETEYSCDPDINAWVKNNKTIIATFSRKEISTFSIRHEKAILRSYTPERKKEIWQEKIDYLLNLDLSKEEINVLKWYADAFKLFDYSKNKISSVKLQKEMYDKALSSMKEFNWSKEFIYKAFFTVGNISYNKEERTDTIDGINAVKIHHACDCKWNIGCGGLWSDCSQGYCGQANGCGIFGGATCTGTCVQDDNDDY